MLQPNLVFNTEKSYFIEAIWYLLDISRKEGVGSREPTPNPDRGGEIIDNLCLRIDFIFDFYAYVYLRSYKFNTHLGFMILAVIFHDFLVS